MIPEVEESIDQMRAMAKGRPDVQFYMYQNEDMGHRDLGHSIFVLVGPGASLKEATPRAPDHPMWGMGWRYVLKGRVDLETGEVIPTEKKEAT